MIIDMALCNGEIMMKDVGLAYDTMNSLTVYPDGSDRFTLGVTTGIRFALGEKPRDAAFGSRISLITLPRGAFKNADSSGQAPTVREFLAVASDVLGLAELRVDGRLFWNASFDVKGADVLRRGLPYDVEWPRYDFGSFLRIGDRAGAHEVAAIRFSAAGTDLLADDGSIIENLGPGDLVTDPVAADDRE